MYTLDDDILLDCMCSGETDFPAGTPSSQADTLALLEHVHIRFIIIHPQPCTSTLRAPRALRTLHVGLRADSCNITEYIELLLALDDAALRNFRVQLAFVKLNLLLAAFINQRELPKQSPFRSVSHVHPQALPQALELGWSDGCRCSCLATNTPSAPPAPRECSAARPQTSRGPLRTYMRHKPPLLTELWSAAIVLRLEHFRGIDPTHPDGIRRREARNQQSGLSRINVQNSYQCYVSLEGWEDRQTERQTDRQTERQTQQTDARARVLKKEIEMKRYTKYTEGSERFAREDRKRTPAIGIHDAKQPLEVALLAEQGLMVRLMTQLLLSTLHHNHRALCNPKHVVWVVYM